MLEEILGNLTVVQISFIGALFTLVSGAIIVVSTFISTLINNWVSEKKSLREENGEEWRQARELAVQLAIEECRAQNQSKVDALAREWSQWNQNLPKPDKFLPTNIDNTVNRMWKTTTALMPNKGEPAKAKICGDWNEWFKYPVTRFCEWWLSK